jgi:hypothetical protein
MDEWTKVPADDDMIALDLAFPDDVKAGAQVTLSSIGRRVNIWADKDKGGSLVVGGALTSKTWEVGADTVPKTLWVEAVGGSTNVNDVSIDIFINDSQAHQKPVCPTTLGATELATAVGVSVVYGEDPTATVHDVIVGQPVNLHVAVDAPAEWRESVTYTWDIGDRVLYDYVVAADDSKGYTVPLAADNAPNAAEGQPHVGTSQKDVSFFNVRTMTGSAGPESRDPSVSVANVGGMTYRASTKLRVYTPTSQGVARYGNAGIHSSKTKIGLFTAVPNDEDTGVLFTGSVAMPAGVTLPNGEWHFVQMLKFNAHYTEFNLGYHHKQNGRWLLDGMEPYPANVVGYPFDVANAWSADGKDKKIYDTPSMPLTVNKTEATDTNEFKVWQMFRPNGGKWVPLELADWGYSVEVSRAASSGPWALDGAPTTTKGAFAVAASYPEWQEVKLVSADQWEWDG